MPIMRLKEAETLSLPMSACPFNKHTLMLKCVINLGQLLCLNEKWGLPIIYVVGQKGVC